MEVSEEEADQQRQSLQCKRPAAGTGKKSVDIVGSHRCSASASMDFSPVPDAASCGVGSCQFQQ